MNRLEVVGGGGDRKTIILGDWIRSFMSRFF